MHQGTLHSVANGLARFVGGRLILTSKGLEMLADYDRAELNPRKVRKDLTQRCKVLLHLVRVKAKKVAA